MTYEQAKNDIFGTASIPDGYNGHRENVGLCYDSERNRVLCVCENGYFFSGVEAESLAEAISKIDSNHPCVANWSNVLTQ